MIIAQIWAGLGNQLFQYAAARRLAHVHQTVLKLDAYHFKHTQFRRFGLEYFNINAAMAATRDVVELCPLERWPRLLRSVVPGRFDAFTQLAIRTINRVGCRSPYFYRTETYVPDRPVPPLLQGRVASERFYHFDPELLTAPDDICLSGFWQSEKYFKDVSDIIRRELTVKKPLSGKNLEFARRIQAANSVSLHVRRGDKATQAHHYASTVDFCERVLKFFRGRLAAPRFFVFTDDWDWVRKNLSNAGDLVFADHNNDETNYEDLRLMSLCQHNVVAPSSFSWWGAWLNPNPAKIVVRPPSWMNMSNHDPRDVFPADWIILD